VGGIVGKQPDESGHYERFSNTRCKRVVKRMRRRLVDARRRSRAQRCLLTSSSVVIRISKSY
jgi:hypothetical protein